MTQDATKLTSPTGTVAHRVQELRQRRGWSAAVLADRCAEVGMPALNRSVIANIESGRRHYVTVDEALTLAFVLDVAPVHLLVPTERDEEYERNFYRAAPDRMLSIPQAREWLRGNFCPPGRDPRSYYSEVPREEFEFPRPSEEEIAETGEGLDGRQEIHGQLFPEKARKGRNGKR